MDNSNEAAAKPNAEAPLFIDIGIQYLNRSYEGKHAWYFLVYKPFNRSYEKDPDWYKNKSMDYVRKHVKRQSVVMLTRELLASKTHINVLACSENDLELLNGKVTANNKYKIHVERLTGPAARHRVYQYIFKESRVRDFEKYRDYNIIEDPFITYKNITPDDIISDDERTTDIVIRKRLV